MINLILLIIVGFVLLIKGADFLVDGSSAIAKRFGISEIIIGLTVVSIGTSMPELFVSATSVLNGSSDISVGNVIGSSLCNLLFILGLTAIIRDVKMADTTKYIEIPFLIVITFVLFAISQNGVITQKNGFLLMMLFMAFVVYTIIFAKREIALNPEISKNEADRKQIPIFKNILKILIGVVALKYGGDMVVNNATKVAIILGVTEKIISITIVAIGTSLPELVTSGIAAFKGDTDMAVGNIIGSNIFNLLLVVGVSCIIKPINYNYSYNEDLLVLFIASIVLLVVPMIGKKDYITKKGGILFLISYIGYMLHLIRL